MDKSNKNEDPKILVSKVQHILEWTKTKIYLDTNSEKAKNRIVRRGEVYKCNFGIFGAGLATALGCLVSFLLFYYLYYVKADVVVKLSRQNFTYDR